jgi:CubicO group peptidase (beta-lactamase class C family)
MKSLKCTLFIIFLLQVNSINAQIQKGELRQGQTLSSDIAPGERHRYQVNLDKDQFAFFKVMQKGVDLMITTYDTNGNRLEDFDSPNGKNGPELITLISGEKGKYIIEIYPFDEKEPKGTYELNIEKIKPKAKTTNEKVDELFTAWDNNYSPGAAIAVVKDGKTLYKKGYGMANLEYDIPITPTSVFHIASVSKQFTVFSVLLLEKEGKLSLDDDIRKYIPEVPDFGKTITLRHLASHTSGLRDQWELLIMAGWRSDDVITTSHILKMVSKQKELNFNPGEEFLYCNTGFTLLAEVVARVSGKSFAEFTKANIFDPLQMSGTLFYDDHEKNVKNRAYSYHADMTGYKKSNLNYANVGATSLFTTVEDLSRWALNFSSMKIGDKAIFDKMSTPAVLNNGTTFGGALGQFIGNYKGLNEIQHGGADAGYRSYLTRFPDQKVEIIVLSNAAEFNAGRMAYQVADIYLKDQFAKPALQPKKDEIAKPALMVERNILQFYVGEYQLQPGAILTVTEKEGFLSGQITGQAPFQFSALSTSEFEVAEVGAKVAFLSGSDGKIKGMTLDQSGQKRELPRILPFDVASIPLSDFEGRFFSDELTTEYNLKLVNGKLIMKHPRIEDMEFTPTKAKDSFSCQFGEVEFVRDAGNAITGFKITTGRVRNLSFKKLI